MEPQQKRLLNFRTNYKISLINRYVLSEVAAPFFGGLVFFTFIFLMFQLLRLAEFFIVHGVSFFTLLRMTGLMCLNFLPLALPVAFLISVLVGFGRLSGDSELVALKASGISLYQLARPLVGLALGVVLFGLMLNLEWVPWGQKAFKDLLIKVGNSKAVGSLREGTFTSGFYDLLVFADKVDSKTNTMQRVFIYDEREPKNPMAVVSRSGEIIPLNETNEVGAAAILKLHSGSIHRNDVEHHTYQKINFQEYKLFLKMAEGNAGIVVVPEMLTYRQLVSKIRENPLRTYAGNEFRAEYWRRFAVAITPLFFVFLGIGFGTIRTRSVKAGAALTTILILLLYWGLQTTGTILAMRSWLHPMVAMQLSNISVVLLGFYSFKRAVW